MNTKYLLLFMFLVFEFGLKAGFLSDLLTTPVREEVLAGTKYARTIEDLHDLEFVIVPKSGGQHAYGLIFLGGAADSHQDFVQVSVSGDRIKTVAVNKVRLLAGSPQLVYENTEKKVASVGQ